MLLLHHNYVDVVMYKLHSMDELCREKKWKDRPKELYPDVTCKDAPVPPPLPVPNCDCGNPAKVTQSMYADTAARAYYMCGHYCVSRLSFIGCMTLVYWLHFHLICFMVNTNVFSLQPSDMCYFFSGLMVQKWLIEELCILGILVELELRMRSSSVGCLLHLTHQR
jgi:hypothetical protein